MQQNVGWTEPLQYQSFCIGVRKWQYKLFISDTKSQYGGNRLIQFRGIVGRGVQDTPSEGLIGREVLGDIEIPLELRESNFGCEHNAIELGHIHFVRDMGGFLGLNLHVSPLQFDVLFQTFAAFSSVPTWNALSIGLLISHNDWQTPGYWKDGWQTGRPRVAEYNVFSAGDFYSPDNRSLLSKLLFPRTRRVRKE